jgi:hypothetical protein
MATTTYGRTYKPLTGVSDEGNSPNISNITIDKYSGKQLFQDGQ